MKNSSEMLKYKMVKCLDQGMVFQHTLYLQMMHCLLEMFVSQIGTKPKFCNVFYINVTLALPWNFTKT